MLHKFGHHSELNKLGLIICEHPWLRGSGDRLKFLADLVGGFLNQLSGIPKILILRVSDWNSILESQPHLVRVRRIQVLDAQKNGGEVGGKWVGQARPGARDWDGHNLVYAVCNYNSVSSHCRFSSKHPSSDPSSFPVTLATSRVFWEAHHTRRATDARQPTNDATDDCG